MLAAGSITKVMVLEIQDRAEGEALAEAVGEWHVYVYAPLVTGWPGLIVPDVASLAEFNDVTALTDAARLALVTS